MMPQGSFSYTLDPSFLNPETGPIFHTCDEEVSSSVEDVVIASGQATYEYDEGHATDLWSDTNKHLRQFDKFSPKDLDNG